MMLEKLHELPLTFGQSGGNLCPLLAMATTTAELEAKLRRRMEKCEGSNAMSPKRGQRVWSDEMAKTVSQQRRARLSKGQSQGSRGGAGNPQDVEGMDALPRSISASSFSRPPRVQAQAETVGGAPEPWRIYRIATFAGCILLLAFLLIWGQFGRTEVSKRHPYASKGQDGWRSLEPQEKDTFAETGPTVSASPGGVLHGDDSALSSDQPEAGMLEEEAEPDLGNAEDTAIDFHGMVKDASIASHGPSVSIDTRTSGDVSDDWHVFLDQHPALEQVFSLGKVTFSKHSSRSSSLTLNATITNTGSTAWSSAVLQAVHGSDMGISSLPLSGVVEPGKDCKVSLRLRLPHEDVIPASMWALSIDDRVFGPLLLLELEQEEDASGSSLLKEQRASARIFEAPRRLLTDQALREDAARVGDISEEWAADLAKTGMAQAYRLGSIVVTKSSPNRMASFELLVHLTNTGESFWPEGTSLRLVSGRSLDCEVVPISQQVGPGSSADVSMRLQVPTQEDPEEIMQDSVWALADRERFFGPLLILELSRAS
eukprot:s4741_g3.t2